MVKYKTKLMFGRPIAKISIVHVDRETPNFIYIEGYRIGKITEFDQYHDSWEKAHKFLIGMARKDRDDAKKKFDAAMDKLAEIRRMMPGTVSQ